jgi:hypothetical protein
MWRDKENERVWHVDNNDCFTILWREQARLSNAAVFTVVVTPTPEAVEKKKKAVEDAKKAAEDKKEAEKKAAEEKARFMAIQK